MKKRNKIRSGLIIVSWALGTLVSPALFAQGEQASTTPKPAPEFTKSTFENGVMINNQTVEVSPAKSVDMIIQHRFGTIVKDDGKLDGANLLGIYNPSNIRLGVNYGVIRNLMVGVGATKNKHVYDFQLKYKILGQKGNLMPVTVTYYGDMAISTLAETNYWSGQKDNPNLSTYWLPNRMTFFHEVMVARKFNRKFSLQLSGYYTHLNLVDSVNFKGLSHENFGASILGRYKFSPQSSVVIHYNMPLTTRTGNLPRPDLGIGVEMSTGSHQFQFFLCTADAITSQEMRVYNTNDFTKKQMMIGFNIMRQWGFK